VERGLSRSRNQAAKLIESSLVKINGSFAQKPSQLVIAADRIEVLADIYLARSAEKLIYALDNFQISVPKFCLDVGASTGGFTQVLLERGAEKIIALDVGTDQLAKELKEDERVIDLSGVNVREASRESIPLADQIQLVVVDLSFISLTLVATQIFSISPNATFIFLVKPQFELQREMLNKSGVVAREHHRIQGLTSALQAIGGAGLRVLELVLSPIKGSTGNIEYLAHAVAGPPASLDDLLSSFG
jgi:23S rRNA (cytidine1920-2'-O)/16S rRNA (cytidine1409-2'-O)-methyltransferase